MTEDNEFAQKKTFSKFGGYYHERGSWNYYLEHMTGKRKIVEDELCVKLNKNLKLEEMITTTLLDSSLRRSDDARVKMVVDN